MLRVIVGLTLAVGLCSCGPSREKISVTLPDHLKAECGKDGKKLRVHFYNVGQALSALVDLPDGRHILVDTADSPDRPGCGAPCVQANDHLLKALAHDLGQDPIAMVWITHQHSDHIGGASSVINAFHVENYVDNGRDLEKAESKKAHSAATARGVAVTTVDTEHKALPITGSGDVKISVVVPQRWPANCTRSSNAHPNECSIALRLDYCASSVLFTGDAEAGEEKVTNWSANVTLLQVGHHGSDTSSSSAFIAAAKPRYAVISAGKRDEGMNRTYCHPRRVIVERLTMELGGAADGRSIEAFEGASCRNHDGAWSRVPASSRLWATEQDGDVVLQTAGDGLFTRVEVPAS